jgi:hypothetical protein
VVTESHGAGGVLPSSADVANMAAETDIKKWRRSGTHVIPQEGDANIGALTMVPARTRMVAKPDRAVRPKIQSAGPREMKSKNTVHHGALPPPSNASPSSNGDNTNDAPKKVLSSSPLNLCMETNLRS